MREVSGTVDEVNEFRRRFEHLRRVETYSEDGRRPLHELYESYDVLRREFGWRESVVFEQEDEVQGRMVKIPILSFRTPGEGPALWVLSGIHGEEPAGPNAIAREIEFLGSLGSRIPMVVLPLCNPKGYRRNWRFPNTQSRKYKSESNPGGGVSVGDADHLLADIQDPTKPRIAEPLFADCAALTSKALDLAGRYPPVLVIDHHEDEALNASYIYSQGVRGPDDPVAQEIIRILRDIIPIQMKGVTRFGEQVQGGIVSFDGNGALIRDGSIDELLTSMEVIVEGQVRPGPAAQTGIVVETPVIGTSLEQRIAAHSVVMRALPRLWEMAREG